MPPCPVDRSGNALLNPSTSSKARLRLHIHVEQPGGYAHPRRWWLFPPAQQQQHEQLPPQDPYETRAEDFEEQADDHGEEEKLRPALIARRVKHDDTGAVDSWMSNTRELAMLSDEPDRSWLAALRQDDT